MSPIGVGADHDLRSFLQAPMRLAMFDDLWRAGARILDRGVNQQDHQLQVAARAETAGASEPIIFAALVHDLCKPLHTVNHGAVAAECFPTLPADARQILRDHAAAVAWIRGAPDVVGPADPGLIEFAEWDAASFDHAFARHPLAYYDALLDEFLEP